MRLPATIVACAAVFAVTHPSLARAASDEDCRKFHRECEEARALGYRDAGICHVERLECPSEPAREPDAGVRKRTRPAPDARRGQGGGDAERSIGP